MTRGKEFVYVDPAKLKEVLEGTGHPLNFISEVCGKSEGWLSMVLRKTHRMEVGDLNKISRFFNVDISDVIVQGVNQEAKTSGDIDRLIEAIDRDSAMIVQALEKHSEMQSDDITRLVNTLMRMTEKMENCWK